MALPNELWAALIGIVGDFLVKHINFPKSKGKDSDKLVVSQPKPQIDPVLEVVNQIKEFSNTVLIENETTLAPVLSKSLTDIDKVYEEMGNLFHIQHGRGDIGRWRGFLLEKIAKEDSPEIKECLSSLERMINSLHDSLYGYAHSSSKRMRNYSHMKNFVYQKLDDREISLEELRLIIQDYLRYLRSLTEEIGVISGRLNALLLKNK